MRMARRDVTLPVPHATIVNIGRPAIRIEAGRLDRVRPPSNPVHPHGMGKSAATPATSPPAGPTSYQPTRRPIRAEAGRLDRVRQPQLLRIIRHHHPSRHSIEPSGRRRSLPPEPLNPQRRIIGLEPDPARRSGPHDHRQAETQTARRSESARRQAECWAKKPDSSPDAGSPEAGDE